VGYWTTPWAPEDWEGSGRIVYSCFLLERVRRTKNPSEWHANQPHFELIHVHSNLLCSKVQKVPNFLISSLRMPGTEQNKLTSIRKVLIRISAGHRLSWLRIFVGFPPSLKANTGTVPSSRPRPLPLHCLQVHRTWSSTHIIRCYITWANGAVSLNALRSMCRARGIAVRGSRFTLYSLCDKVVIHLWPVGRAMQTWWGVPKDLKQGPGGMDVLERCFPVTQLNSGYTCRGN